MKRIILTLILMPVITDVAQPHHRQNDHNHQNGQRKGTSCISVGFGGLHPNPKREENQAERQQHGNQHRGLAGGRLCCTRPV